MISDESYSNSFNQYCSRHFRWSDLICAGQTFKRVQPDNVPQTPETWTAIEELCRMILDPVVDEFGSIKITYGFASPNLTKHIKSRICESRDQHAGHEVKQNGTPICRRLGMAVDILSDNAHGLVLARWIAANLPFDRMYIYGSDRPLHISYGPEQSNEIYCLLPACDGRRLPRRLTLKKLIDNDPFTVS